MPHGCWCGKFTSNEAGHGGKTVDEVDNMCKQWHQCRACSFMKSCQRSKVVGNFTVKHDVDEGSNLADQFLCHELSDNQCGADSCSCDLHFSRMIIKYLEKPGNHIDGTTHHFKQEKECKLMTQNAKSSAGTPAIMNINNGELVGAISVLNSKLDEIKQQAMAAAASIQQSAADGANMMSSELQGSSNFGEALAPITSDFVMSESIPKINTNIGSLFNAGTGEDIGEDAGLNERDLDAAVVFTNDECCGEAPLWIPFSTSIQECKNNRIYQLDPSDLS